MAAPAPAPPESLEYHAPEAPSSSSSMPESSAFEPYGAFPTTSSLSLLASSESHTIKAGAPSSAVISITSTATPVIPQALAPLLAAPTAKAPAVSFVLDTQPKPSVVTLQIVDGKLVTAGAAAASYSIALPGPSTAATGFSPSAGDLQSVSGAGSSVSDAALQAPNLYFANPLMNLASEIVNVSSQDTSGCSKQCLPFQLKVVKCNADFPFLSANLSKTLSANEQKTNTSLTSCLCEPFIQRNSCKRCFTANSTLAAMPQISYFSGMESRCPAPGKNETAGDMAASKLASAPLVAPTNIGLKLAEANSTALEGVDRDLLASICNGTGLAKSDPKTYEACKKGQNVAAILNTTDAMLRQKLPSWKGSSASNSSTFSTGKDDSEESVEVYCSKVLRNDHFWFETCIRHNGASKLLQGVESRLMVALAVLSTGVWLLV
ncbi:hypothetical protein QFC19_008537 [Naganishia cerealis]|uniref:Uncharacterized protein n=1 Tax=Naganishia cerealis TaxID=610337 RepID=A0ACC2V1Q0_9TREE|nr:hypothetical protein QFC19_008537 [Naganishia cerealis]